MNMKNVISVIVPIYNVESYLKKCIESILNQSYQYIQIILVNDGSTDSSDEICYEYEKKDSRIMVINKKNGGLVSARKEGLKVANGEYVGFIDGDDWIEVDMYKDMIELILKNEAEFVQCGTIFEKDGYVEKIDRFNFTEETIDFPRNDINIWKSFILSETRMMDRGIVTKLYKTEFIKECYSVVPNNICYGEDFLGCLECIMRCQRISFLGRAYYHYVYRDKSYNHTWNIDQFSNIIRLHEHARKRFKKYGQYNGLKQYLNEDFISKIINCISRSGMYKNHIPLFKLDFEKELVNKRIILYGAGRVGQDYYFQLKQFSNCFIVAWVDRNYHRYVRQEMNIASPDSINGLAYDVILIAVKNKDMVSSIMSELCSQGIPKEKCFWKKPISCIEEN